MAAQRCAPASCCRLRAAQGDHERTEAAASARPAREQGWPAGWSSCRRRRDHHRRQGMQDAGLRHRTPHPDPRHRRGRGNGDGRRHRGGAILQRITDRRHRQPTGRSPPAGRPAIPAATRGRTRHRPGALLGTAEPGSRFAGRRQVGMADHLRPQDVQPRTQGLPAGAAARRSAPPYRARPRRCRSRCRSTHR